MGRPSHHPLGPSGNLWPWPPRGHNIDTTGPEPHWWGLRGRCGLQGQTGIPPLHVLPRPPHSMSSGGRGCSLSLPRPEGQCRLGWGCRILPAPKTSQAVSLTSSRRGGLPASMPRAHSRSGCSSAPGETLRFRRGGQSSAGHPRWPSVSRWAGPRLESVSPVLPQGGGRKYCMTAARAGRLGP